MEDHSNHTRGDLTRHVREALDELGCPEPWREDMTFVLEPDDIEKLIDVVAECVVSITAVTAAKLIVKVMDP